MRTAIFTHILRAPETEGGSATPAPGPVPSGAGEPPAETAGATTPDTPPADQAATGTSSAYRPEGLADHFLGETDQQTIDKMKAALDGYRRRDSERGVPEDAAAYAKFEGEIPDTVKPHLDTLTSDPLFARMAEKAKSRNMSLSDFQSQVTDFLAIGAEMGLLEPALDPAKEFTALLPDHAANLPEAEQRVAVSQRIERNLDWLKAMGERGPDKGGIAPEVAKNAETMLGDSAAGVQFIEWVRSKMEGVRPAGGAAAANPAGITPAQLRERGAEPKNTPGHPLFDQASYDQLMADYERVHGA